MRKTYEEIIKLFNDNACELSTSKDEYDNMKMPNKCKIAFKTSCGHDNTVTLTNFVQKKSGVICKMCMKKQVSDKLVEYQKNNDKPASKGNIQENKVFNKLNDILNKEFDIIKTNEGCTADFVIKPKFIKEDKWLAIQLKTTHGICHNLYSFRFVRNKYENMIILCYCISDNSIWCIPHDIIKHLKNSLNIGLTDKSVYNKYKVTESTLFSKLNEYFNITKLDILETYMIPENIYQQNEIKYKEKREKYFDFIQFKYPEIEQCYFDFKINGKNIQEKIAFKNNKRIDSYIGCIYRSKGKNKKQQYLIGMNEYYWIHIPDTDLFYLIPEFELYNNGFITDDKAECNSKKSLSIKINYEYSWYYKYQYNYTKLDKELFLKMFDLKSGENDFVKK